MNLKHMHDNLESLWAQDGKKYQTEYASSVLCAAILIKHAISHNIIDFIDWKMIALAQQPKEILINEIDRLSKINSDYEQIFNYGLNAIKHIDKFSEYEISQILAYANNINLNSIEQVSVAIQDLNSMLGNETDDIIKQLIVKQDNAQITAFGCRILSFIKHNPKFIFNSFHLDKYRWREALLIKIIFKRDFDRVQLKNFAEDRLIPKNSQEYFFLSANREVITIRSKSINSLAVELSKTQAQYEFKLTSSELELKIPDTDLYYAHIIHAIDMLKPTGELYLNIRLVTWQLDELITLRKFLTVNKLISKVIYIKTSRRDPWILVVLSKQQHNKIYMLGENFYNVGGLKYALNQLITNRTIQAVINQVEINNACGNVEISAIKAPNYSLDPKTCLRIQTSGAHSPSLFANSVLISDICEIFRGPGIYSKNSSQVPSDPNYFMVGHSAITEHGLSRNNLIPINKKLYEEFKSFAIVENDLILLSRSTNNRVTIVPPNNDFYLANINILVLRPNPKYVNPIYLLLLLNSPKGRALIASIEKGITLKSISIKSLKKLELNIVDMAQQNQIANDYIRELSKIEEANKRFNQAMDNINSQL